MKIIQDIRASRNRTEDHNCARTHNHREGVVSRTPNDTADNRGNKFPNPNIDVAIHQNNNATRLSSMTNHWNNPNNRTMTRQDFSPLHGSLNIATNTKVRSLRLMNELNIDNDLDMTHNGPITDLDLTHKGLLI